MKRTTKQRVLRALRQGDRSREELIDAVVGDRDDGGPLTADSLLSLTLTRLRRDGYVIKRKSIYTLEYDANQTPDRKGPRGPEPAPLDRVATQ